MILNMKINYLKNSAFVAMAIVGMAACKKDKTENPKQLRAKIDYAKLVDGTKYDNTNTIFVDANGKSTIDVTTGNFRYRVFQGINTYAGFWKTQTLDANVLKNMYKNSGNPFTILTNPLPADFAALNASGVQLRNVTASSWPTADAETVRLKIEADFTSLAAISASANVAAVKGTAGYVTNNAGSKYLIDAKGLETGQLIQKGLIGAFDLDYIGNILLMKGLEADNYAIVSGKNYTQLEQKWDEAYGSLTLSPIYLAGSTDATRGTTESFIGSYLWEYNKANYAKIFPAFLKGRAAIVNNDITELKAQALFIRTQMEYAIANSAWNYLKKWKDGVTAGDAGAAAHALGEGLGFIYSLRFATVHNADAKFSNDIITALIGTEGGAWDLTTTKVNAAQDAIKAQFGL